MYSSLVTRQLIPHQDVSLVQLRANFFFFFQRHESSEGWGGGGQPGGDLLLGGIFLEMSFQGRARSHGIDRMLSPSCHGGGAGLIVLFRDAFDFLARFFSKRRADGSYLGTAAHLSCDLS